MIAARTCTRPQHRRIGHPSGGDRAPFAAHRHVHSPLAVRTPACRLAHTPLPALSAPCSMCNGLATVLPAAGALVGLDIGALPCEVADPLQHLVKSAASAEAMCSTLLPGIIE